MLLRLPPAPARPLGRAAHRAPHAERKQHPGHGAAGHAASNSGLRAACTGAPRSKAVFTPDADPFAPGGISFFVFFFILCRAPTFPTESTPPQPAALPTVQVSGRWE